LSEQLKTWLTSWSWGGHSASDVVRNAQAFVRDGHRDPTIERIARSGSHLGNAERALRAIVPLDETCNVTHVAESSVEYLLLPHEMFGWIQATSPRLFRIHLGAKEGGVQTWWENLRSSQSGRDFWDRHPWLAGRTPADLRYHVPLVAHEDAGPVSHHNSAVVRSWYSICGVGGEVESRFLVSSRLKSPSVGGIDKSWPIVMESFEKLSGRVEEGK